MSDPRDDQIGPALFDLGRALGVLDRGTDDMTDAEAKRVLEVLDGLHDLYIGVSQRCERQVYPNVTFTSVTVRPLHGANEATAPAARPSLSLVQ